MSVKLSRWKRFSILFLVCMSLFVFNFQFFSVYASANAVEQPNNATYVVGLPFDVYLTQTRGGGDAMGIYDLYIPAISQYVYDSSGTPSWAAGVNGSPPVQFMTLSYAGQNTHRADIVFQPNAPTVCNKIVCSFPVCGGTVADFERYNATIGFYDVGDMEMTYTYTVIRSRLDDDGNLTWHTDFIVKSLIIPESSNSYTNVPLFNFDVLTPSAFAHYGSFDLRGNNAIYIVDFQIVFNSLPPLTEFFINDKNSEPMSLLEFQIAYEYDQLGILDKDILYVNFDDIEWTEWLVTSVKAFMNFEIVPNLSIAGIFSLLIGMSLFMIFLKTFAGG